MYILKVTDALSDYMPCMSRSCVRLKSTAEGVTISASLCGVFFFNRLYELKGKQGKLPES